MRVDFNTRLPDNLPKHLIVGLVQTSLNEQEIELSQPIIGSIPTENIL